MAPVAFEEQCGDASGRRSFITGGKPFRRRVKARRQNMSSLAIESTKYGRTLEDLRNSHCSAARFTGWGGAWASSAGKRTRLRWGWLWVCSHGQSCWR